MVKPKKESGDRMKKKTLYMVKIGESIEEFAETYLVIAKSVNEAMRKAKREFEEVHGMLEPTIFSVELIGKVLE